MEKRQYNIGRGKVYMSNGEDSWHYLGYAEDLKIEYDQPQGKKVSFFARVWRKIMGMFR